MTTAPPIFLAAYGPHLLVLHALCATALGGATIHQGVVATLLLRGRARPRLLRVYGLVSLCLYGATLLFGALLYPRYRLLVRALYLDRHAPWAANLFDLKENLATLGVPLAIGAFLLSREPARLSEDREARWLYACFALSLAALCAWNIVSGLLCTSVRGLDVAPHRLRAYLACALCIGTSLGFFLTELLPLPVPVYYPALRRWGLGAGAGTGIGMDYYGRSLAALLAGVALGLVTIGAARLIVARRGASKKGAPAGRPLLLCTAWAATAFALCASLYAYKLSGRELTPDPLPAWYQPR